MLKYVVLLALIFTSTVSCVKDIDFDQADDIALTPVAEVDFVYFTLTIDAFQSSTLNEGRYTIVDTTEVRFFEEDFSVENISSAEFFFQVTNTFPVALEADFTFLSDENMPFYNLNFPIALSQNNNAEVTEFTQSISNQEMEQLTQSNKVVITISIETEDETLEGELNLQSKTTYYLQF